MSQMFISCTAFQNIYNTNNVSVEPQNTEPMPAAPSTRSQLCRIKGVSALYRHAAGLLMEAGSRLAQLRPWIVPRPVLNRAAGKALLRPLSNRSRVCTDACPAGRVHVGADMGLSQSPSAEMTVWRLSPPKGWIMVLCSSSGGKTWADG